MGNVEPRARDAHERIRPIDPTPIAYGAGRGSWRERPLRGRFYGCNDDHVLATPQPRQDFQSGADVPGVLHGSLIGQRVAFGIEAHSRPVRAKPIAQLFDQVPCTIRPRHEDDYRAGRGARVCGDRGRLDRVAKPGLQTLAGNRPRRPEGLGYVLQKSR
jgi:hypothetical protein